MHPVVVFARIEAKPGQAEAVKQALLEAIPPTRQEEGCVHYDLHQDRSDETLFYFHETWTEEALLNRHLESGHIARLRAALDGRTESIEVKRTTRIG